MGTFSLNAATAQLHQAMDDYRDAYDAATTADTIAIRNTIETAHALLQSAKDQWGTDRGYKLLASAERHLRFALGGENDA